MPAWISQNIDTASHGWWAVPIIVVGGKILNKYRNCCWLFSLATHWMLTFLYTIASIFMAQPSYLWIKTHTLIWTTLVDLYTWHRDQSATLLKKKVSPGQNQRSVKITVHVVHMVHTSEGLCFHLPPSVDVQRQSQNSLQSNTGQICTACAVLKWER